LLAVALLSGAALIILDRRAGHADKGAIRYIERFSPDTITAVPVGAAGLTLLVKAAAACTG
jgi:hypothetical protein